MSIFHSMKATEQQNTKATGRVVSAQVAGIGKSSKIGRPEGARATILRRERGWVFLLVSVVILVVILWSNWNRGWAEMESGLPQDEPRPPTPQAHVPTEVMEKLVTHRVDPDYPAAARRQNLQGVIVLDVVVGSDGAVVEMHPVNGPEILAHAAMEAMRWWRFEPYRVNGQPVVAETTVAMEFKP